MHVSAMSHAPADARHTVVDDLRASLGHAVEVPVHVSAMSHAPLAARHTVVAGAKSLVHEPVAALQRSLIVQGLPSSPHVTAVPAEQTPAMHTSAPLHRSPSSHGVPSAAFGFEHVPVVGSHVPALWHGPLAVQITGFAPVHAPATHVSLCVQLLPSLQAVPFAAVGFEQAPVAGLQTPATWH